MKLLRPPPSLETAARRARTGPAASLAACLAAFLALCLAVGLATVPAGCGAPPAPVPEGREGSGLPGAAPPMTAGSLLEAARRAGDYLVGIQGEDGTFPELYDGRSGATFGSSGDNHLLQAGLCEALFRLYRASAEVPFRVAGDRCLGFLRERAREPRPEHRREDFVAMTDGSDRTRGDLGATARTLSARIERAAATGDLEDLASLRRMARFLVFQQDEVGTPSFHYLLGEPPGGSGPAAQPGAVREAGDPRDRYAPSQAALALVRMSRLDPENEEGWRQAAERFAGWIMAVRDLGKTYDRLPHDLWLVAALTELYEVSGGRTYFLHARRISEGILREQSPGGEYPGRAGSFFTSERALPTALRAQALGDMARLAVAAGEDPERYLEALGDAARFLLRCRSADGGRRDPAGVRDGLHDRDVSTGTVLHAINAWLGLRARLLSGETPPSDPAMSADGRLRAC